MPEMQMSRVQESPSEEHEAPFSAIGWVQTPALQTSAVHSLPSAVQAVPSASGLQEPLVQVSHSPQEGTQPRSHWPLALQVPLPQMPQEKQFEGVGPQTRMPQSF